MQEQKGATVGYIAEHIGVSARTIHRELEAVEGRNEKRETRSQRPSLRSFMKKLLWTRFFFFHGDGQA